MRDRSVARKHPPGARPHQIRIIGGVWRGRKLPVPDRPGLRPSPDRVRETLFNWLAPVIEGARCLDLFAGSGAFGFEAASRGAREVVLVEGAADVARALSSQVERLRAAQIHVTCADALRFLSGPASAFDIVFLDPPFGSDLLEAVLPRLVAGRWLAPRAWIYVELPAEREPPPWPAGWECHRTLRAGRVVARLLRRGFTSSA